MKKPPTNLPAGYFASVLVRSRNEPHHLSFITYTGGGEITEADIRPSTARGLLARYNLVPLPIEEQIWATFEILTLEPVKQLEKEVLS